MSIRHISQSPTSLDVEDNSTSRPAKILVVDDDGDMRALLSLLLSHAGFDVTEASNGDEGLQRLSHEHFDLVVTDVAMPVKDGLTMIAEARTLAPKVKFIVHSGSDREILKRVESLGSGSTLAVLSKPTPPSTIVAAVKDALRACGRDCRDDEGQAAQSRDAPTYANPLFGAVREILDLGGSQAARLESDTADPPASRDSCWRLHPPWTHART